MSGPSLQQLSENAYAWIGAGGNSNAGAVITAEGITAIDAQQTPALGREFRASIEKAAAARVTRLIDTHLHLDHTTGNIAFADVPIIAHRRTADMLEAELGPARGGHWTICDTGTKLRLFFGANIEELVGADLSLREWFLKRVSGPAHARIDLVAPRETFAHEMTIATRDGPVHLTYWGPAHCDGDLIVHLPERKIAFLGDLLFVGRFPWLGDCDLDGWIATLDRLLGMDLETVVPGHGPVSTLREIRDFWHLLAALRGAVAAAISRGLSEEAVAAEIALPEFEQLPRYREWLKPNLRSVYRYLKR
ncbi:MAG TPA: MBL fold metallo-hydrolase [Pseudolabrys sp.]|nr:MBL fold metallo-hydrolase [Pseudolabrys sp.]